MDALDVVLHPPTDRKDWPTPFRRTPKTVDVASFCIDRLPVLQGRVEAHEPCDGNPQPFDAPAPATCIRRYEADAWCEAQGGRLPTVAQWEAIARSDGLEALEWVLDRDWVADAYPPAIFAIDHATDPEFDALFRKRRLKRAEADGVHRSWNRHDGHARWTHSGFRCAYPLGGS